MSELNHLGFENWIGLINALKTGILITDEAGFILYANIKAAEIFQRDQKSIIGQPFGFPLIKDANTQIEIIHTNQSVTIAEIRMDLGFWLQEKAWIITLNDITERKMQETQLNIASGVFSSSLDSIIITDIEGTIVNVNEGFENIMGYKKGEVIGKNVGIIKSGNQESKFYKTILEHMLKNGSWQGELSEKTKKGKIVSMVVSISSIKDLNNDPVYFVAILHDISQLKKQERQLELLAHYDPLTRLPNLNYLEMEVDKCINKFKKVGQSFVLAYLNLDKFQTLNSKYSHAFGDKVLKIISKVICKFVANLAFVARVSGDQFVILLKKYPGKDVSSIFLINLLKKINKPIKIDANEINIQCSIGYLIYSIEHSTSTGQIIRQSEAAMYESKIKGGNQITEFDLAKVIEQKNRYYIEHEVLNGILENQFVVHYQPKVEMKTGRVIGAEALIRWQHPTRGLCLPGDFLPYLQNYKVISLLSSFIFDAVLKQLSQWIRRKILVKVSINVSAEELQYSDFLKVLNDKLFKYNHLVNNYLELEILESSAVSEMQKVKNIIRQCHQLGVSVSLDDFGTGYSSLNYLRTFNVDTLKIELSFINDMIDNPKGIAIFEAILYLTNRLGQTVIAEGVDTIEKGQLLMQLGCKYAQGFLIGKPMAAPEFEKWMSTWNAPIEWQKQESVDQEYIELIYLKSFTSKLLNELSLQNNLPDLHALLDDFNVEFLEDWLAQNKKMKLNDNVNSLVELTIRILKEFSGNNNNRIPSEQNYTTNKLVIVCQQIRKIIDQQISG